MDSDYPLTGSTQSSTNTEKFLDRCSELISYSQNKSSSRVLFGVSLSQESQNGKISQRSDQSEDTTVKRKILKTEKSEIIRQTSVNSEDVKAEEIQDLSQQFANASIKRSQSFRKKASPHKQSRLTKLKKSKDSKCSQSGAESCDKLIEKQKKRREQLARASRNYRRREKTKMELKEKNFINLQDNYHSNRKDLFGILRQKYALLAMMKNYNSKVSSTFFIIPKWVESSGSKWFI